MSQLRILHIVDNLSTVSGVSHMIMNIYRAIDRKRIQFDFLVAGKKPVSFEAEIIQLGGRVFYFGNPLSLKTIVSANRNAKNFFKDNSAAYHIIHLHSPTMAEFTIRHARRYGANKIIIHSHSTMTSMNKLKSFINELLVLRIKSLGNVFWACSREAGYFLYGYEYCCSHHVETIYNAIEPNEFSFRQDIRARIRSELGIDNKIVVTHISNFNPIKNHMFLSEVIKNVSDKRQDILFLFIGDGPAMKKFVDSLESCGASSCCMFAGEKKNVNDYLQASDLVVLPSIKEGLPVIIVEAQASGLPCLISDTITKDVKVGDVKYIPLNTEAWVENILSFEKVPPSVRLKSSKTFADSVFNVQHEARRIMKLYEELERVKV